MVKRFPSAGVTLCGHRLDNTAYGARSGACRHTRSLTEPGSEPRIGASRDTESGFDGDKVVGTEVP
jgi:hypothetical protein